MLESMSNRTPLERVMNAHRIREGLRWKDVLAAADNMAAETLRRVRLHGTDAVDDFTIARLERGLQLPPGGLREMEAKANAEAAGADPQPASAPEHDGERVGPDDLLHADERLLWRDEARGRRYWLADKDDASVNVEYLFEPGETPDQVVDDLRDLLAPYRVAVEQMERRRARR